VSVMHEMQLFTLFFTSACCLWCSLLLVVLAPGWNNTDQAGAVRRADLCKGAAGVPCRP
jgi:hypothetical protein